MLIRHLPRFIAAVVALLAFGCTTTSEDTPQETAAEEVALEVEDTEPTLQQTVVSKEPTKVFFANKQNVRIYQQPQAASTVLDTLTKGDAVKGLVQDKWIALSSGGFVDVQDMSEKPVGRKRDEGNWK